MYLYGRIVVMCTLTGVTQNKHIKCAKRASFCPVLDILGQVEVSDRRGVFISEIV